jgi:DNA replication and repair protein RecF
MAATPALRLHVARLTLSEFRSHAALELALDGRPVCLYGANGAGKTNILEALTMLAPGRGLRGAAPIEIARGGEAGAERRQRLWSVAAEIVADGAPHGIGAAAERTGEGGIRRIARLNGAPASGADLAALVRLTWVTPSMDRLFAGPPGDRRRFLDRLTFARAPEHGQAAAGYERALKERQRLLNEGRFDDGWLTALEREMAAHGAALAHARAETAALLQAEIARRPEGAFPKAALRLSGPLEEGFAAGRASGDLEEDFLRTLCSVRGRDSAAGRTLDGPHRSDLIVRHAPKDIPAELCSTGEQKALLVGLVLAHARALAEDPGAGPALVLLDEAAAHLDAARRAALYEELLALPGQSWLTGTDAELFDAFGPRAELVLVGG